MNRMLIGLAVLSIGAVAVGASILKKQAYLESHRRSRQIILYYTLSRLEDPVIVLGDSITAQRFYQANAQSIKTQQTVDQTLLQM